MKLTESQIEYAHQFNLTQDEMTAFVEYQEQEEQRLKEWWYDQYRVECESREGGQHIWRNHCSVTE